MLGVSDVEYYKGVILVFQIVADLRPVLVIQGPETPGISGVHSGAEHRDVEHGGGSPWHNGWFLIPALARQHLTL